ADPQSVRPTSHAVASARSSQALSEGDPNSPAEPGLAHRGWVGRILRSAVLWSWLFNGLRLASGVLLLPLLVRVLSEPDVGMYYVFVRLAAIIPMMDFGFSLSIE